MFSMAPKNSLSVWKAPSIFSSFLSLLSVICPSTQTSLLLLQESLLHKRSLLLGQTDDARELKDNLERRQRVVHSILSAHLDEQQLQDYRLYVSAKPSLLVRQRHLDNLLRQAEEQLALLRNSLPPEVNQDQGSAVAAGVVLAPSPTTCPALLVAPAPLHRPTAVTSL